MPEFLASQSMIQKYQSCRKKYEYTYLHLLDTNPSPKAVIGSAVHNAIDHDGDMSIEDAVYEPFAEAYQNYPELTESVEWQESERLALYMAKLHVPRVRDTYGAFTLHTEIEFKVGVPGVGDAYFVGKVDRVIKRQGEIIIVEHKTTAKDLEVFSSEKTLDFQTGFYIWNVNRAFGLQATAVEFDCMSRPTSKRSKATPSRKRKYKKDGTLYANQRESDESLDQWIQRISEKQNKSYVDSHFTDYQMRTIREVDWHIRDAIELVREMKSASYFPRNTGTCHQFGTCHFKSPCIEIWNKELLEMYPRRERVHRELKGDMNERSESKSEF